MAYYGVMRQSILKSKKLPVETKAAIVRAVCEILNDPDFGLELSTIARARLRKAATLRGKGISFSSIQAKYS